MTESKLIKTALYCHAYGASRRSIRNLLDTLAKRKPARWRARVAKQAPTLFNKRVASHRARVVAVGTPRVAKSIYNSLVWTGPQGMPVDN